jgi:hypothetical protein
MGYVRPTRQPIPRQQDHFPRLADDRLEVFCRAVALGHAPHLAALGAGLDTDPRVVAAFIRNDKIIRRIAALTARRAPEETPDAQAPQPEDGDVRR